MIEQLKLYDLFAKNLFETIIFVKEKIENDFSFDRAKYREILDHLTNGIQIPVTTYDFVRLYNEECKILGDEK